MRCQCEICNYVCSLLLLFAALAATPAAAQRIPDTLDLSRLNKINERYALHNIFEDVLQSLVHQPAQAVGGEQVLFQRSESSFRRYQGRTIRFIYVRNFGFDRRFEDTSRRIAYFGARLMNRLHARTQPWVIRNNLFFKENTKLNALQLADNERFLRTIPFIQDVRLIIQPVGRGKDSVDVVIITKDLFSLKAVVDISGTQDARVRLSEENFLGMAHRMQTAFYGNRNRRPMLGFDAIYGVNNLAGTFINVEGGYSGTNNGPSSGTEDEQAFFLRLSRPLVSPYTLLTGAAEFSSNTSLNVYQKSEDRFLRYAYTVVDAWLGYNLGLRHVQESENYLEKRRRTLVSLRYANMAFTETPAQVGMRYDPIYNSQKMILGQLTFFKQDFYKANYIFGFGTTEDIPSGYNASATLGWHRQLFTDRIYGGLQAEQFLVTKAGGFLRAGLRLGAFIRGSRAEDVGVIASVNYFMPIVRWPKMLLRPFLRASYAQIDNRVTTAPLHLNNPFGLREFNTDSAFGERRITIASEAVLFTRPKLFGFRFAPFLSLEASVLSGVGTTLKNTALYSAVGGGLRSRNENLIFGTIELRAVYFPRVVGGLVHFRLLVVSDLKYRYRTRFISAPNIVPLNSDNLD